MQVHRGCFLNLRYCLADFMCVELVINNLIKETWFFVPSHFYRRSIMAEQKISNLIKITSIRSYLVSAWHHWISLLPISLSLLRLLLPMMLLLYLSNLFPSFEIKGSYLLLGDLAGPHHPPHWNRRPFSILTELCKLLM